MLIGEQPGDVEDLEGEPFVGPAGQLLDKALAAASISPDQLYLTNAVKHFRWQPARQGTRRIHQRPTAGHVRACQPWLRAEFAAVQPAVIVALGAIAAQSLLGNAFRLTRSRGQLLPTPAIFADVLPHRPPVLATIHPSAVLRSPDRTELFASLVADLRAAAAP
jgi:DNA polymerase